MRTLLVSSTLVAVFVMVLAAVAIAADPAAGQNPADARQASATKAANSDSPFAEKPKATTENKTRAELVSELNDEQMGWYLKVRALADGPLSSSSMAEFRDGEKQLMEMTDPKALWPMGLAMYTPNMRHRSAFLKAVTQFARTSGPPTEKMALAYLSDMAIGDKSNVLRGQARAAILHPDTPKYTDQLRYRLTTFRRADVRERAAAMLADLKETAALSEMIEMLTTEEVRMKGAWIDSYSVIMDIRAQNAGVPVFRQVPVQAATPGLGIATATIEVPTVRVTEINTSVVAPAGYRVTPDWEISTRRHVGVLAALKELTGEDFGYDKAKWRQWLNSQRDKGPDPSGYGIQWDSADKKEKKD